MASSAETVLVEFTARLQETIAPYRSKVEYGNLREQIDCWETSAGDRITNVALVYETPGGSTDQINISFDHQAGQFSLIVDDIPGEYLTDAVEDVLQQIAPRIKGIPIKRRDHLRDEIQRRIDAGEPCQAVVGHLNRLLSSEFRGGRLTHLEMRDAMTFAIQYSKAPAAAGQAVSRQPSAVSANESSRPPTEA